MHPMNETKLWNQYCLTKSEEDFDLFYRSLNGYAYTVARAYLQNDEESLDALHDGWLRFLKEQGASPSSDIKVVLGRSIAREADRMRKRRTRQQHRELVLSEAEAIQSPSLDPHQEATSKEQEQLIRHLVEELPDKFRIPLVLFYFHGVKQKDISAILSRPEGTISWQISEALKRLEPRFRKLGLGVPSVVIAALFGGKATLLAAPAGALSAGELLRDATLGSASVSGGGVLGTVMAKVIAASAGVALLVVIVAMLNAPQDNSPRAVEDLSTHGSSPSNQPIAASLPSEVNEEEDKPSSAPSDSRNEGMEESENLPSSPIDTEESKPDEVEVSISVLDTDGSRVIPDQLTYSYYKSDRDSVESTIAPDAGGKLHFSVPGKNSISLSIQADGYLDFKGRFATYNLPAKGQHYTARINRSRTVKGLVNDSEGLPVANAKVLAISNDGNQSSSSLQGAYQSEAWTNSYGEFEIDDLPEKLDANYLITHDNHGFVILRNSKEDDLNISLKDDGVSLSGIIQDITGAPLPSGSVVLSIQTEFFIQEEIGADGSFTFNGISRGDYSVFFHQPDITFFQPSVSWNVRVGSQDQFITLPIGGPVEVRGQLLESGSDRPLSGAKIQMNAGTMQNGKPMGELVTTDHEGRFVATALAYLAGSGLHHGKPKYQFSVGLEEPSEYLLTESKARPTQSISFESLEELEDLKIYATRAVTVEGMVYRTDGKRLRTSIEMKKSFFIPLPVDQGSFSLQEKPGDSIRYQYFGEEGYALGTIDVPADVFYLNHDIHLKATASVSGMVFDSAGKPISGIRLEATLLTENMTAHVEATSTDAEGAYLFQYLPTGEIEIAISRQSALERKEVLPSSKMLTLASEDRRESIDFRFGEGTSISGRVLNEEGTPQSEVSIMVHSRKQYLTDSDGNFQIDGLSIDQSYNLSFNKLGYDQLSIREFNPLDGDLELVLKKPQPKTKVVGELDGQRIDTFRGMLLTIDGDEIIQRFSFFSNKRQSLNFTFSEEYSYKILVAETHEDDEQNFTGRVGAMTFEQGKIDSSQQDELLVPLSVYTPLKAKIIEKSTGEPLVGEVVRVQRINQYSDAILDMIELEMKAIIDENGTINLLSTPFDDYRIQLMGDDYRFTETIEVSHRADDPIEIELLAEAIPKKNYTLTVLLPEELQEKELSYDITMDWKSVAAGTLRHDTKAPVGNLTRGSFYLTIKDPTDGSPVLKNKRLNSSIHDNDIIIDMEGFQRVRIFCEDFTRPTPAGQSTAAIQLRQGYDSYYLPFNGKGIAESYLAPGIYQITENIKLANVGFQMWGGTLTVGNSEDISYCPREVDLDVVVVYPESKDEMQGTLKMYLKRNIPENVGGSSMAGNTFEMPKVNRRFTDLPAGLFRFEYTSIDEQWAGETEWLDFEEEESGQVLIDVGKKD